MTLEHEFEELILIEIKDEKLLLSRYKFVPKVWGLECWVVNNEKYCMKILNLMKYSCSSAHFHKIKDETFHVMAGSLYVRLWTDQINFDIEKPFQEFLLSPGNSLRITPGLVHCFYSFEDCQILEVSTQHVEEDSYRFSESKINIKPNHFRKLND